MPLERRRHLRHKVHSPAYASVGAGAGGVVLDVNERGAAIETLSRLVPQSFVDLRLDLLETRGSAVSPARVAWSDESGRAGLEFLNLTGESQRKLQEWLLLNTLLASEDAGAPAQKGQTAEAESRVSGPAAEPSLQAMAERALACTGANGAAIALAQGEVMVCRAAAGDIAPPLGTTLDAEAGISGTCVRTGRWLRCDDPRLDPHVDRESCRALGINSVLAVPIGERGSVLGLIEVFSQQTYAFREEHCSAVQRLAYEIARSLGPNPAETTAASPPEPAATPTTQLSQPEPQAQNAPQTGATAAPAPARPAQASAAGAAEATPPQNFELASGVRQRVILLGLLVALVLTGLWFALGRGGDDADAAEPPPVSQDVAQDQPAPATSLPQETPAVFPESLRSLRRQAEAGDSEAAFELGAKFAGGEDVRQDYIEAVKWFTRAAQGGQILAAATLGAYYWAGRGVPQDDISAYMWSSIAKEGGDEASKYRIAILRARMSAGEIAEAERRISAWRETHPRLRENRR